MTDEQKKAANFLTKFLAAHEADIATEHEDYGDLNAIFVEVFKRRPLSTRVIK